MVDFKCPECGVSLRAPDEMTDKAASCPQCGKSIKVPS